ncbi:hypothetical protein CRENBAI_002078 [Crenichthys baileyi]|uniref:Uncharacterized protein n=1 Tax=Crenichthys baileyi TaxID=28760 RepID=A0AAV9RGY1_9TELE
MDGGTQRANVSLRANRHNSSNWIQECHTITRAYALSEVGMNCCLCIRYSFMNGVIKVQALLDFLSEVYRSKLCSREFPAETLSLGHRVEQFSRSEGRTTGQHHRGYSSNVQFGQPDRASRPTPQLRRLAAANPLFTVEAFLNFVAWTTFPQHRSQFTIAILAMAYVPADTAEKESEPEIPPEERMERFSPLSIENGIKTAALHD